MIGDNCSDQIQLPDLRCLLVQGDFVLKQERIEAKTRVTEDFAELLRTALESMGN